MFCIAEQTVFIRDGITLAFKNVVHKNNIVEIVIGETMHQLHFLKGGDVIKVETMPVRRLPCGAEGESLTGSTISTMSE